MSCPVAYLAANFETGEGGGALSKLNVTIKRLNEISELKIL